MKKTDISYMLLTTVFFFAYFVATITGRENQTTLLEEVEKWI